MKHIGVIALCPLAKPVSAFAWDVPGHIIVMNLASENTSKNALKKLDESTYDTASNRYKAGAFLDAFNTDRDALPRIKAETSIFINQATVDSILHADYLVRQIEDAHKNQNAVAHGPHGKVFTETKVSVGVA